MEIAFETTSKNAKDHDDDDDDDDGSSEDDAWLYEPSGVCSQLSLLKNSTPSSSPSSTPKTNNKALLLSSSSSTTTNLIDVTPNMSQSSNSLLISRSSQSETKNDSQSNSINKKRSSSLVLLSSSKISSSSLGWHSSRRNRSTNDDETNAAKNNNDNNTNNDTITAHTATTSTTSATTISSSNNIMKSWRTKDDNNKDQTKKAAISMTQEEIENKARENAKKALDNMWTLYKDDFPNDSSILSFEQRLKWHAYDSFTKKNNVMIPNKVLPCYIVRNPQHYTDAYKLNANNPNTSIIRYLGYKHLHVNKIEKVSNKRLISYNNNNVNHNKIDSDDDPSNATETAPVVAILDPDNNDEVKVHENVESNDNTTCSSPNNNVMINQVVINSNQSKTIRDSDDPCTTARLDPDNNDEAVHENLKTNDNAVCSSSPNNVMVLDQEDNNNNTSSRQQQQCWCSDKMKIFINNTISKQKEYTSSDPNVSLLKLKTEEYVIHLFLEKLIQIQLEQQQNLQNDDVNNEEENDDDDDDRMYKSSPVITSPNKTSKKKSSNKKLKEHKQIKTLRAGDIIEYHEFSKTVSAQSLRKSMILECNPGNDIAIETQLNDYIPKDEQVRLVQRYLRGTLHDLKGTQTYHDVSFFHLDSRYNDIIRNKVVTKNQMIGSFFNQSKSDIEYEMNHIDDNINDPTTQDKENNNKGKGKKRRNRCDDDDKQEQQSKKKKQKRDSNSKQKCEDDEDVEESEDMKRSGDKVSSRSWFPPLHDCIESIKKQMQQRRFDKENCEANLVAVQMAITVRDCLDTISRRDCINVQTIVRDISENEELFEQQPEETIWNYLSGNPRNLLSTIRLNEITNSWKEWLQKENDTIHPIRDDECDTTSNNNGHVATEENNKEQGNHCNNQGVSSKHESSSSEQSIVDDDEDVSNNKVERGTSDDMHENSMKKQKSDDKHANSRKKQKSHQEDVEVQESDLVDKYIQKYEDFIRSGKVQGRLWLPNLHDRIEFIKKQMEQRRYDKENCEANLLAVHMAITVRDYLEAISREDHGDRKIVKGISDEFEQPDETIWNYLSGNTKNLLSTVRLNELTDLWKQWLKKHNHPIRHRDEYYGTSNDVHVIKDEINKVQIHCYNQDVTSAHESNSSRKQTMKGTVTATDDSRKRMVDEPHTLYIESTDYV